MSKHHCSIALNSSDFINSSSRLQSRIILKYTQKDAHKKSQGTRYIIASPGCFCFYAKSFLFLYRLIDSKYADRESLL